MGKVYWHETKTTDKNISSGYLIYLTRNQPHESVGSVAQFFTCVHRIEAMYEKSRVSVKVERGSTFTFARNRLYIGEI